MITNHSKIICMLFLIFGAVIGLPLYYLNDFHSEILIESVESKTAEGESVYNKISLVTTEQKDIWLMKQSHSGVHGKWDELKIEIDKTVEPYKASYFQYQNSKEVNFRVACYKCHANGPRAIRPNYKSKVIENSYIDKIKIALWNIKIKHYGKIITPQNIKLNNKYRKIPLKYIGRRDKRVIEDKACSLCHGEGSLLGRSDLVFQQRATIKHLVTSGEMPPWPFSLSENEKKVLLDKLL